MFVCSSEGSRYYNRSFWCLWSNNEKSLGKFSPSKEQRFLKSSRIHFVKHSQIDSFSAFLLTLKYWVKLFNTQISFQMLAEKKTWTWNKILLSSDLRWKPYMKIQRWCILFHCYCFPNWYIYIWEKAIRFCQENRRKAKIQG